jgi:hypothetical protein
MEHAAFYVDTLMSTQFSRYPNASAPPAGIFEHFCEHPGCQKWGGWGYPRGRGTTWFCYEHREDGEIGNGTAKPRTQSRPIGQPRIE